MEKKLTVAGILTEGAGIGIKNLLPILVNTVLWIITIWIPYLNIGTTIGMAIGIVSKASKGETISMTEIFNPQYRKYMGEFFLTYGLVLMGVSAGMLFLFVPGLVISLAWSLALLLAVDKGINPVEAISKSNNATYGSKATIFIANLLLCVIVVLLSGVFARIPAVGPILVLALVVCAIFVGIGMQAYVYRTLTSDIT